VSLRVFDDIARAVGLSAALALLGPAAFSANAGAEPRHGIAMHGEPALPPDFEHLPYANPDAPQGGRIGYGNIGSFDSLNPFIVRGTAPRALWDNSWGNNVWESLLARNRDEPFSLYGLLAETVETPPDRSWVEFTLRPEARFSDGRPVTAEDVIFSAELLREKGRPNYRSYYANVERMEKAGERGVRFTFREDADREQPLLIGLMPILPKHGTDPETFDKTSFSPPFGSGPYLVERVEPGSRIVLRKDADYWGRDLPIKRGFDNFDEIRVEYFRDANAYFEAFKKGLFDINPEGDPARWATGYDFPAVQDARVVLDAFPTGTPSGMNGFVLNTRRPVFQDPLVRQALGYFFDFEWINQNLYHGLYERTGSYFDGSELSALGRAAGERERELLAPYPDAVRADVMEGAWQPPESDGSGRDRANLRKGLQLLAEAGYERQAGRLVHKETGLPLAFEILVQTREQERLALSFERTLELAGIAVSVRQVDSAQYEERRKSFDFDVVQFVYPASLSPGSEQYFRWSQQAAEAEGSYNLAGASRPALDAMIGAMLAATSREDFVAAVRALDRVLISGFYVVPLFHAPEQWIARWARIQHPDKGSLYGAEPTTWWSAP
jgi:peptide/nickel transport system substrate-binding protein